MNLKSYFIEEQVDSSWLTIWFKYELYNLINLVFGIYHFHFHYDKKIKYFWHFLQCKTTPSHITCTLIIILTLFIFHLD